MNSLKEYGDLFLKLNLSELSIKEGDFSLVLKKDGAALEESPVKIQSEKPAPVSIEDAMPAKETSAVSVKAPLLGIFEELSGDRAPIKEGDQVKKGDVLCTIEAMKMLNEVVATTDGTVVKICAKPGDLVEYNQDLFLIE